MSDRNERSGENPDKYIRDIATIKDILLKTEQKPIYEHWAFCAWGILIIIGSAVHFFVQRRFEPTVRQLFLEIWLPVMLIAGFIELVTYVRTMSRHALTLFTRTVRRFYLSVFGSAVAFCLLLIMLNRGGALGYMPIALLLGAAVFYFLLAQVTYTHVYIHGYLFLVFAILLFLFGLTHEILVPIVGLLVGFSMIGVGITIRIQEKSKHGNE
jgi:hypothetical protein